VRVAEARTLRAALEKDAEASPIIGLQRAASTLSSSYRAEVVTVRRRGAADVRIFLKDFARFRRDKGDMAGRRRRELCVYRELLAGAELGTPRYHGAVWDERRGRFWLLLEYVDAPLLRYLPFERWLDAARWLGLMQAHFAGRDLAASDFLAVHDASFYKAAVEGATRAIGAFSPGLACRLDAALRDYEERVAEMADAPPTLVHGVYRPHNILAAPTSGTWRVCVTDWEESAQGCPLYDLACLADGFDRRRLHLLIDAYEGPLARAGMPPRDRRQCLRLLAAMQVQWNLRTLAKASVREIAPERAERLVGRVEALALEMR